MLSMSAGRDRCHTPQVWVRCTRSGSMRTPMLLSLQPPDSEGFVSLSATSSDHAGEVDWQGLLKTYRVKQSYLDWTPAASTAAPSTPTRRSYPLDMTAFPLDVSAFREHMEVTRARGPTQVCVGVARVAFHVWNPVVCCMRSLFLRLSVFLFFFGTPTMYPKRWIHTASISNACSTCSRTRAVTTWTNMASTRPICWWPCTETMCCSTCCLCGSFPQVFHGHVTSYTRYSIMRNGRKPRCPL